MGSEIKLVLEKGGFRSGEFFGKVEKGNLFCGVLGFGAFEVGEKLEGRIVNE